MNTELNFEQQLARTDLGAAWVARIRARLDRQASQSLRFASRARRMSHRAAECYGNDNPTAMHLAMRAHESTEAAFDYADASDEVSRAYHRNSAYHRN